ncbi:MFS transporter [Erythrobacter sp. W53]|uniref:MFS transporter n=1 Tax=Erythrobacter sp. W53 TaxID=3425947 RepID=UPI003D7680D0
MSGAGHPSEASPHSQSSRSRAIVGAAIVTIGGFIFGLDAALISGGIGQISEQFRLSDLELGAVVGAPGFGVLFALVVTGAICDRIGRRKTLILIASLYLVSAITSAIAPSFETLVLARGLGGLAFTSLSVASIYIGEVAPAQSRGRLVALNQLNIVIGLSVAFFISYGLFNLANSGAAWVQEYGIADQTWRWMLGAEIVPALIWLVGLLYVGESPRWLYRTGKVDEAEAEAARLYPPNTAKEIMTEIRADADGEEAGFPIGKVVQMLFKTHLRKALFVALLVALVQPLTGINAILFYAPLVFQQVGVGEDAALAQAVIVGLVSVVFTAIALFLVDRLGRRFLINVGLTAAGASLLLCWWAFSQASYVLEADDLAALAGSIDTQALSSLVGQSFADDVSFKAALVDTLGFDTARAREGELIAAAITVNAGAILFGIVAFIAAYNFSIGPVLWIALSELFPTRVRGVAVTGCAFVVSLMSYFVQQFFPWQLANWGAATVFLFYAAIIFIGLILLFWKLPETKGKTIEEIEAEFRAA